MSPLAAAAITVAQRGSGGGRMLRGCGGIPFTPWQLADVWASLPESVAEPCWAALAREAGVSTPEPTERARVLDELRRTP